MDKKEIKGILALAAVTALSFAVIAGSRALSLNMSGGGREEADVLETYDVSGEEHVEKAVRTAEGYEVTVREAGYVSDIVLLVSFKTDASTVAGVQVLEQNETESLGSRIAEPEFLDQFRSASAPFYLTDPDGAALTDGTYHAQGQPDASGYTDQVSVTISGGRIAGVTWDAVAEDGSSKSILSENGMYTMTEDGPTWSAQSKAVTAAVVERQSLSFLKPDEAGKTDAIAVVSISVDGFMALADQCLSQAAGGGTQVDAVSGATRSSTAAVSGVNDACDFLQSVLERNGGM